MVRPKKLVKVDPDQTCLSLEMPTNSACSSCISSQPSLCDKPWEIKEGESTDEEMKAYIDAWLILTSCKGYGKPDKFRYAKKKKRWGKYIKANEELYKHFTPSPCKGSSNNPTNTPTRTPYQRVPKSKGISSLIKSAIKTPLTTLKAILKIGKSTSSSPSTPEPTSPTTTQPTLTPSLGLKLHQNPKRLTYDETTTSPIYSSSTLNQNHHSPLCVETYESSSDENSSEEISFLDSPRYYDGECQPSFTEQWKERLTFPFHRLFQLPPDLSIPHPIQTIPQKTPFHDLFPSSNPPPNSNQNICLPCSSPTSPAPAFPSFTNLRDPTPLANSPPELGEGSTRYPILKKLGVKTINLDPSDQAKLKDLVSDVVDLCRNNNIPLDFQHKGNNRRGRLIPIAPCKDKNNFLKRQRNESWIDGALQYLTSNNVATKEDAAEWVSKYLASNYEKQFMTIAFEYGCEKKKVMCPKATAIRNGKTFFLCSLFLFFINPLSFGIGDPTDAQPPWRWRGGFLTKSCAHPHLFATIFYFFHYLSLRGTSSNMVCYVPKSYNSYDVGFKHYN